MKVKSITDYSQEEIERICEMSSALCTPSRRAAFTLHYSNGDIVELEPSAVMPIDEYAAAIGGSMPPPIIHDMRMPQPPSFAPLLDRHELHAVLEPMRNRWPELVEAFYQAIKPTDSRSLLLDRARCCCRAMLLSGYEPLGLRACAAALGIEDQINWTLPDEAQAIICETWPTGETQEISDALAHYYSMVDAIDQETDA